MKKYLLIALAALSVHAFAVDCEALPNLTSEQIVAFDKCWKTESFKPVAKAYHQLLPLVSTSPYQSQQQLEVAQKSWVNYRNATCELNVATVATEKHAYTNCIVEFNSNRAAQLQKMINDLN